MIRRLIKRLKPTKEDKNRRILPKMDSLKHSGPNFCGIQIIFVLVAFLYGSLFLFSKGLIPQDETFTFLRLKDVALSLMHGHLSQFNLWTFQPVGSATSTFYPYILFLPFILLMIVVKAQIVLGLLAFSLALFGMELAYYIFHKKIHYTRLASFLIALLMYMAPQIMGLLQMRLDIGAMLAYALFPMAFYGWLKWIHTSSWKTLCVSMILICIAHIMGGIITATLLGIFTILQYKMLTKKKIINGIKSVIFAVLCLSFLIIPMLVLTRSNIIYFPNTLNIKDMAPQSVIPSHLDPVYFRNYDFIDIVAIILGVKYWHRLNLFLKQIFVTAIIIIVANFKFMNNILIGYTPLHIFQSMDRFTPYSHLLLVIILILGFNYIFQTHTHHYIYIFTSIVDALLIIDGFFVAVMPATYLHSIDSGLHKEPTRILYKEASKNLSVHQINSNQESIYTNLKSYTQLHTALAWEQYPDYEPLISDLRKPMKKMVIKPSHFYKNGVNYKVSHQEKKRLPILIYNQQRYYITNNGKHVHYSRKYHYAVINLHKGKNRIRVQTPVMWYRYVGDAITALGICGLIICDKKKKD